MSLKSQIAAGKQNKQKVEKPAILTQSMESGQNLASSLKIVAKGPSHHVIDDMHRRTASPKKLMASFSQINRKDLQNSGEKGSQRKGGQNERINQKRPPYLTLKKLSPTSSDSGNSFDEEADAVADETESRPSLNTNQGKNDVQNKLSVPIV